MLKNLDFKPVFLKVFFTYLVVYFFALIFRYNYDLTFLLNNIHYKYLIFLNILCVFFGVPLTAIFDFILIKLFGLYYVLFFSPVLTVISVLQVIILRKLKFKFFDNIFILNKPEKNYLFKFFVNITFKSNHILIIRSLPILPHILGSYIIASSKIKKTVILINTLLGSVLYYTFLFLIIGNA